MKLLSNNKDQKVELLIMEDEADQGEDKWDLGESGT
jgi:hypothetical protein